MEIPHKPPFTEIRIIVEYVDGYGTGGKWFENVHQLALFLKTNPAFAEALGYIPKKKR